MISIKEFEKLFKELKHKETFVEKCNKQLSNENFVSRAKPETVEKERKKLSDGLQQLETLKVQFDEICDFVDFKEIKNENPFHEIFDLYGEVFFETTLIELLKKEIESNSEHKDTYIEEAIKSDIRCKIYSSQLEVAIKKLGDALASP